jgi:hypothetical protein
VFRFTALLRLNVVTRYSAREVTIQHHLCGFG